MAKKRSKTKTETPEEKEARLAQLVQRDLDDLLERKHLYQNPTKTFDVGESVDHVTAAWRNIIVIDKVDGLFYKLEYDSTDHNYGNPITTRKQCWRPWTELVKLGVASESKLNRRAETQHLQVSFYNTQMSSLIHRYYYFGVDMTPDYQRDFVWTYEDKVRLLDSIFDNIEIGKFAFIHLDYTPNSPQYEIIDGKQRLTTIIEFIEDRFEYKGHTFSQLSKRDRDYFHNFYITMGDTREELTQADRLEYFLRLNTGGVAQTQEHLNKVRDMLASLKTETKETHE